MNKVYSILFPVFILILFSFQTFAQETKQTRPQSAFQKRLQESKDKQATDTIQPQSTDAVQPLLADTLHPQSEEKSEKKTKKNKSREFTPGWALSIKASSFGPGIEIVKSFSEVFNLRLGGSYWEMDYGLSFDNALAMGESGVAKFGSVSLLADFNFLSFMHFTGGIMYNMNELIIDAKSTEDYYVGEIRVDPETLGTLSYSLTPNKVCPYVALGFGRSISRYRVVSFTFEVGLIYQGPPKVGLDATGMLSPTSNYEQQQLLEENVQTFVIYPVMNFQLSFRIK